MSELKQLQTEMTAIRHTIGRCPPGVGEPIPDGVSTVDSVRSLAARASDDYHDRVWAEAAIARVRELHESDQERDDLYPHCLECTKAGADVVPWPCPTLRALDAVTR